MKNWIGKNVPRGTWDVLLLLTVLVKVAVSPLSFASAVLLVPVTILYVTKFVIRNEHQAISKTIDSMRQEIAACENSMKIMTEAQAEVFRQAEQTKTVISKLNLSSAFAPRSQRKQD